MSGQCSYYFDENDASTWGPDKESAAYWQERYEELVEAVERECEDLRSELADTDEEMVSELESELNQKQGILKRGRKRFPLIGDELLDDGKWKCPHEAIERGGRCIFHQSPSDGPSDAGAEKEALLDAMDRAIEEAEVNYTRFIGASIRRIVLRPEDYRERGWETFGGGLPAHAALDFRCATVYGSFTAEGDASGPFEFGRPVFLSIVSHGQITVEESHFCQSLSADASLFKDGNSLAAASFNNTKFHHTASFDSAEFAGVNTGSFLGAEFTGDRSGSFVGAEFTGEESGSFLAAEFTGDESGSFVGAEFTGDGSGSFSNAEFTGDYSGSFARAEFTESKSGSFSRADFNGHQSGYFRGAKFTGKHSGDFWRAEFVGHNSGLFFGAEFIGEEAGSFFNATFSNAFSGEFGGPNPVYFSPTSSASFEGTYFVKANFSNVKFGLENCGSGLEQGSNEATPNSGIGIDSGGDREVLDTEVARASGDVTDVDEPEAAPVSFEKAEFSTATFDDATFYRPVSFEKARFESESSFEAKFADTATFDGAVFNDNVRTISLSQNEDHSFVGVEFRSSADLSDCSSLADTDFKGARLHRTNLSGVDLSEADLSGADLTGSTLDGTSLRDACLENTILESVHADNETFRRTFGSDVSQDIDSNWIDYTCRYDPQRVISSKEPSTEKRGSSNDCIKNAYRSVAVYQKLEQVARYNALSGPQGRLFLARKNVERCRYWHQLRASKPVSERLHSLSLWLRSWSAKLVLNYGESPWRVIATSVFIVTICGFIYPFGFVRPGEGAPLTYGPTPSTWVPALFDSFYVSLLTFATADLGQFQPVGYGRLLVTAEASAGLVLFALLIFVFGRRAAR